MFETLDYLTLQQYWWCIVSLLGGLLVFMMFIQGGQTLLDTLSENETEKTLLVNSLGRKWELGFTTLVLFGGAIFASFPLFYSVSFGGAYWVWMAILFSFIIQAVSYEYRKKPENFLGQKTFERFLKINGFAGTFLIGAAVSTLISGASFTVDANHFMHWQNPLRGLEALLDPFNWLLGLALIFLVRILAALYFINNIDEVHIRERARKSIVKNAVPFLLFFLTFVGWLLLRDGAAYDPQTMVVSMEPYKYLHNLLAMPAVLVMFALGVLLVLAALFGSVVRKDTRCIWTGGIGTVLVGTALFLLLGLNHTAFYPSLADLQSSLTIQNASGSRYTLTVMSYVSLMVPFVLAYIAYAWYSMDRVKLTQNEIEAPDAHNY
jgi:cytochrome d ubiquinol oxidase subunit II